MYDHNNGASNGPAGPSRFEPVAVTNVSDDIRRYAGLIWHWGWLLVLASVAGAVVGYLASSRQTPVYRASATIWISESRTLNEYANILASERLAETYAQLMTQNPIFEGVIEMLDLNTSAAALKSQVSVSVVEETQLLRILVEDTDPVRAAQIANTIGVVFSQINDDFQASRYRDSKTTLQNQLDQVDQQIQDTSEQLAALLAILQEEIAEDGSVRVVITLEQQRDRDRMETNLALYQQIYANLLQSLEAVRLAEAQGASTVNLVEQADPPPGPFKPNVVNDTALAALIGLIVGLGLVLLLETLDDTVKGPEDINRHLGLPILGYIARLEDPDKGPVTASEPRAPVSEAFRALRTNIQYASVDRPISRILVTSPMPKDGKSTVATNLAVVISQSGRNVALVDADMRRPSLHRQLRLSNRFGLSDLFVQEKVMLDGALCETRIPGMSLVTSGGLPPNPSELIGSEKMMEILRQIRTKTDIVIVDTPPMMAVTDAAVLAPKMDGVVLVVRPGVTKLVNTKQTVEQLRRGGANILGVVLNDIEHRRSRYQYYYRGYYSYDSYYGEQSSRRRGRGKQEPVGDDTGVPAAD
ncbi:MAG TPA: polysaccharide biosynthesis tyrosine autokinase [Anaerolineales bacterium]|nr:polysaccharide biosynthesis tyrosine autokinase [Anaerolineales bacterium]